MTTQAAESRQSSSSVPTLAAQAVAPQKAPPFVISNPSREERYLKLLVYGCYGSGKTYFAATAHNVPKMRDVFYVDVESGDLTLRESFPDIARIQISSFAQLARIHEFLRAHLKAWAEGNVDRVLEIENRFRLEPVTEPPHYRTVVVDSLSEVQALCMYQILGIQIGDRSKLDEETEKASWENYDVNLNMMRRLIRNFRDLSMHVIFVCSEVEKEMENKKHMRLPNFVGKLQGEITGFFDMVGYLQDSPPDDQGVVHRQLALRNGRDFRAKTRFSAIKKPFLNDPSMEDLAAAAGLL